MNFFKILLLLFFLPLNTSLQESNCSEIIPVYGSIPKNVKLYLKNSEEKVISLELTVKEKKIKSNIYLISENGNYAETIVNKSFVPEKYNFNWDYNSFKKGNYLPVSLYTSPSPRD